MRYSIVIPMYNVQGYIDRCLNSLFSQDFDDYELILVDDESSDNTLQEAQRTVSSFGKEPRTTIITKKNSGASDTRNAGIRIAKGEYVIFMDADDQMTSDALAVMDDATRNKEADLYVFSLRKEIEGRVEESELSNIGSFYLEAGNPIQCLEQYFKKTDNIITWQPWSKIFRRSIIEQNNVLFDTSLYCCNDFNFFMKYFLCIKSVFFTNIPTTIYCVERPGSISITKLENRLKSSTKAYSDMFYRIKETGIESKVLLDYMSYLFLCSFDIVEQLNKEQCVIADEIVRDNKEVYYYAKDPVSMLRRFCFRFLGYRVGANTVRKIRMFTRKVRKGNSVI